MSRFDWLMLIAVTVILTLLLSSTSLVQPVARAPDDQLAARIAAIDERLDQIDARLAELRAAVEQLTRAIPNYPD